MPVPVRLAARLIAALIAVILLYTAAGLIGGAIPSNRDWHAPEQGIPVYVESNGVHVGFVLPKQAAGVDWRPYAPATDLADPRFARHDHIAVGWGEKGFYLGTPTWADVKISTIAAAAFGSDATLIHVEHVAAPAVGDDVRRVILRPREYRRLAAYIQASFRPDRLRYRGYASYDAFYDARGHYDGLQTCNAWAGDALRYAGVRVGRWTPFPATVMRWF